MAGKEELLTIRVDVTLQFAATPGQRKPTMEAIQAHLDEHIKVGLRPNYTKVKTPARLINTKVIYRTDDNDPKMGLVETIDRIRELRREADKLEEGCDYDPENYVREQAEGLRNEARDLAKTLHEKTGWIE